MANLLLRWKIQGYERKLKTAERASFYQEEAVSMGPIARVQKAYNAGRWGEAIDEAYKVLLRFHDYSSAYYYLGMALARVGEVDLAIGHLRQAVTSHRDAMDAFDDRYAEDLIAVCREHGRLNEARQFFTDLAASGPKGKLFLDRLQYMGKL